MGNAAKTLCPNQDVENKKSLNHNLYSYYCKLSKITIDFIQVTNLSELLF